MVEQSMQYPTIPRDYLLVKVDKQYEDTLKVGGQELELDTSYDPNWHVRIYGEIVQMPMCVTLYDKYGRVKDEVGIGTVHDVQIGDKVYFHFHTVHEENRIKYLTEQNIYKLHHKQMFCVVRYEEIKPVGVLDFWKLLDEEGYELQKELEDGYNVHVKGNDKIYASYEFKFYRKRLIMCNDRVLVQPKLESWEDIKSASGLILKSEPEPIPLVGVIRHIGRPAAGLQEELHAGDEIYFAKDSEFSNTIEGEDYFVMCQSDILGKYF